jgi:hypothetical protein
MEFSEVGKYSPEKAVEQPLDLPLLNIKNADILLGRSRGRQRLVYYEK